MSRLASRLSYVVNGGFYDYWFIPVQLKRVGAVEASLGRVPAMLLYIMAVIGAAGFVNYIFLFVIQ